MTKVFSNYFSCKSLVLKKKKNCLFMEAVSLTAKVAFSLLFTSIKCAVAFLLLVSVVLWQSLFWSAFLLVVITSRFHGMLFNHLKCFFRWLLHILRSLPPLIINFDFHHQPSLAGIDEDHGVDEDTCWNCTRRCPDIHEWHWGPTTYRCLCSKKLVQCSYWHIYVESFISNGQTGVLIL